MKFSNDQIGSTSDDESLFLFYFIFLLFFIVPRFGSLARSILPQTSMSTYTTRGTTTKWSEEAKKKMRDSSTAQNILSNEKWRGGSYTLVIYVIEFTTYSFFFLLRAPWNWICIIMLWGNYCLTSMNCCAELTQYTAFSDGRAPESKKFICLAAGVCVCVLRGRHSSCYSIVPHNS